MKQPIGVVPITVPIVATMTDGTTGEITIVFVNGLRVHTGPANMTDRHAWLLLSRNQAEVLVLELAAKLGVEVLDGGADPTPTL